MQDPPGEGRLAGQHLVEHRRKRVDVAPAVNLFDVRLLRAHVEWRADQGPGPGEAVVVANAYAPEHLLLAGGAKECASRIRGAGTIFIGETSSVAFGDYLTGANHVLPTGGLARSYSGLSVTDFIRWTTTQRVDVAAAASLAADTSVFADAEGLPGHAAAARQWSAT
jgi:hypothetical protein